MAPEAAYASQIEFSKQGSEDHEAFRIDSQCLIAIIFTNEDFQSEFLSS